MAVLRLANNKKILLFMAVGLAAFLSGCSMEKSSDDIPEYFEPIAELINADDDFANILYTADTWREKSIGGGSYEEGKFSCSIDGIDYTFDLNYMLTESDKWEWVLEGLFYRDGEDKAYALFNDFNLTPDGEEVQERNPQLILIEFIISNPSDYQATSYNIKPYGEFLWFDDIYRIGDNLYFRAQTAQYSLAFINLNTKELHYCKDEFLSVEKYAEDYIQENFSDNMKVTFLDCVSEQNDTKIYCAQIGEANDTEAVGLIYMAYKDFDAVAYMCVNLGADNI